MEKIDPVAMRRLNMAATLKLLFTDGPMSGGPLVARTGLSRRTLEPILTDLIANGWVTESVPAKPGRSAGRPARTFSFNARAGHVLAAQVDFESLTVVVADLSGTPVAHRRVAIALRTPKRARLERLRHLADDLLAAEGIDPATVLAMTVATPGIVRDDGTVDLPVRFIDWTGFSLRGALGELFPWPVHVENDAKLAAQGELVIRDRERGGNFIWVRADGVRIGMGIVIGGSLYRGHDGAAGEIAWAHALRFEGVRRHVLSGLVHPSHPDHAAARRILERVQQGDPDALAEVDSLAAGLAPGLTTLAWVLAPDQIIIGGALSALGDRLVNALSAILHYGEHPVEAVLTTSESTDEAIIRGALHIGVETVKQRLFSGDHLAPAPRRGLSRAHRSG